MNKNRERIISASNEQKVRVVINGMFRLHSFSGYMYEDNHLDIATDNILIETKHDANFTDDLNRAKTLSQALHYIHNIQVGNIDHKLPTVISLIDKHGACFYSTNDFRRIWSSNSVQYEWNNGASNPSKYLVEEVMSIPVFSNQFKYFDFQDENDFNEFLSLMKTILKDNTLIQRLDINEYTFERAFPKWSIIAEEKVKSSKEHENNQKNGFSTADYFTYDTKEDNTQILDNNLEVLFKFGGAGSSIVKFDDKGIGDYSRFWRNDYRKVHKDDTDLFNKLLQKKYLLESNEQKRRNGRFFTRSDLASSAFTDIIEKELGQKFWKTGEWRIWDNCAGTGNMEVPLLKQVQQITYLSTISEAEIEACKIAVPFARDYFQYDYLNDDVELLQKSLKSNEWKLPLQFRQDLLNPNIKWIVFINPPYSTSTGQNQGAEGNSETKVKKIMQVDGVGADSKELYCQFLYRIFKEMPLERTYLGIFSTTKYMIGEYSKNFRSKIFNPTFMSGFVVHAKKHFYDVKNGDFPITFALWDFSSRKDLKEQKLSFKVLDQNIENIAIKTFIEVETTLNAWLPLSMKQPNSRKAVPLTSALNVYNEKPLTDSMIPNSFGFYFSQPANFQQQDRNFILSSPYGSNIGGGITPLNFEKVIVSIATKQAIPHTWLNHDDRFSAPTKELSDEFVTDCLLYFLFHGKNQTSSLYNIEWKGTYWNVENQFSPYSKNMLDIKSKYSDTFTAIYISGGDWELDQPIDDLFDQIIYIKYNKKKLSNEAQLVYDIGLNLYKHFLKNIQRYDLIKWKINHEDYRIGWQQIKGAIKENEADTKGNEIIEKINNAQIQLQRKLQSNIFEYGFLTK